MMASHLTQLMVEPLTMIRWRRASAERLRERRGHQRQRGALVGHRRPLLRRRVLDLTLDQRVHVRRLRREAGRGDELGCPQRARLLVHGGARFA
jgi:hypothetical protein